MSGVLGMLLGGGGVPGLITTTLPDPTGAGSVSLVLLNDGTRTATGQSAGSWCTPNDSSVAALYQVKSDITSGFLTTDPSAGSYIDLSSTRTWSLTTNPTAQVTFTFREKASGLVRATITNVQFLAS